MVIGGSTAAGAGLAAVFGGKKGAPIGAAIGGGASHPYEVKKAVFTEVNAPPLDEEIAQHHAQIEWVGQSPISA